MFLVCLFLDDVFLPKDIDLDSTEMDETEREVEYFKRYACWSNTTWSKSMECSVYQMHLYSLYKFMQLHCYRWKNKMTVGHFTKAVSRCLRRQRARFKMYLKLLGYKLFLFVCMLFSVLVSPPSTLNCCFVFCLCYRFCLDSARQTRQRLSVNWSNFSLKKATFAAH